MLGSWLFLTCSCRTKFEFSCRFTTECISFSSLGTAVLPTNTESNRISCKKTLLYTGTTQFTQQLLSGKSDVSWVLCKLEPSILCMYVTHSPVEFHVQHTRKWSEAVRRSRRLYNRPDVLYLHVLLIALSFPRRNIRSDFQKCDYFIFFNSFTNCVNGKKRRNLKLCKSGIVCNLRLSNAT